MRRSTFRLAALSAAVAMLVLIPAGAALAHGHASQGDLEMEIGFATEPAYTGQPNAALIILVHDGEPVTDLKTGDLTVEVTFGDQTSEPMDVEPGFFYEDGKLEFGEPGEYRANFVPSQPGDYTFHFTGTVDGEKLDEEMTSGPKTFDTVQSVNDAAFPPVDAPTNEELASRIDQESTRSADAIDAATAAAASAEDAASSAKTAGLIGVVLGALGIITAIAAMAVARKRGVATPMLAHAGAADESLSVVLLFAGLWVGWIGWSRLKGRGFPRLPAAGAVALLGVGIALAISAAIVPRMLFPANNPVALPSSPSGPRPASTATLSFDEPKSGAVEDGDRLEVVLTLEGGRIVEAASTDLTPDTGHVHLSLDGKLISMTYGLVQEVDLTTLAAGDHALEAEFVAADHGPFSPRVTTTVHFTTEGP